MAMFTPAQLENIHHGLHPDCGLADPCTACGASEAPGGGGCGGELSPLVARLWRAAYRHDHNNDPRRVLHTSGSSDADLLDEAARALFAPVPDAPL